MIGIVLVSHSAKLVDGLHELAEQMVREEVNIAVAGGVDDPENPFGTDAVDVYEAIQSVYSEDGVVVLMDLGSAILSAETALDMLSDEERANVYLSPAPFVEGTLSAVVQVAGSSSVEEVLAEARAALVSKASQLGEEVPTTTAIPTEEDIAEEAQQLRLTIENPLGLHARPAARFVSLAGQFEARLTVCNLTLEKGPVNAKSINQVATLDVSQGHEILVTAEGSDAAAALAALEELAAEQFGEAAAAPTAAETPAEKPTRPEPEEAEPGVLVGIAASPGITIGPAVQYQPPVPEVEERQVEDPETEWERLRAALETARSEIGALRARTAAQAGEEEAAIFDAHELFLQDPALVDAARNRITNEHINAEAAWQAAIDAMVAEYEQLQDEYLRARAADVADVGARVLRLLSDATPAALELSAPGILVAADLTPSDTAQIDRSTVLGICTARGGATSHSAILARALGIPAVVGLGVDVLQVEEGTTLAIDGETGRIWIDPDEETLKELRAERDAWATERAEARTAAREPATTKDGTYVEVVANVRGPADTATALEYGADGVGLLRTEFLFLDRRTAPTEDEQVEAYTAIADLLGERPLIIRTLDVGGDKPLPYVQMRKEINPFLGQRGIRFTLDHPDLFKAQLRAILRASPGHGIKIMFPMVASVAEVRAAKAILAEARDELEEAGIPVDDAIEVGIMVEVPAAVVSADQLAAEVDFFSIGTNDLSQYVMAADRTNERVATLVDAFQPAVLRMIRQTIDAGHAAGIWVGLCGEMAGDALAVPILLGLGLDEFSMNPPAIPAVKETIRRLTVEEAEAIAAKALQRDSAEAVRQLVRAELADEEAS